MIRHQTSEFERVSNNVSHERLCEVQLAINKFYADKNLVKDFYQTLLSISHLLGLLNRLKLNVSQILCKNRYATGSHQTNQKLVKKMSKTESESGDYDSKRLTVMDLIWRKLDPNSLQCSMATLLIRMGNKKFVVIISFGSKHCLRRLTLAQSQKFE